MLSEPVTKIDTRFSNPDTDATEWAVTRRALETAEIFWITTVRMMVTPRHSVVGVWLRWRHPIFARADTEQKAINLRGNHMCFDDRLATAGTKG